MAPIKVYGSDRNPGTVTVRVAAEYAGVPIEYVEQNFDKEDLSADFKAKFPKMLAPTLEDGDFTVTEQVAIAFYLAETTGDKQNIFGKTTEEKTKILEWSSFAASQLEPAIARWYTPIIKGPYNKKTVEDAKADSAKLYAIIDRHLESTTFLVGERISFADIATATVLQHASDHVVDETFFKQFPNVLRFFKTVLNQEPVKKINGEPTIIDKPKEYVPPAKEPKPTKTPAAAATAAPKAAKASSKKKAAEEEEEDDDEPATAQEPKAKHPCEALGKPEFNLEDWKRKYSNEDTPVAMKWFEEHYKPDEYSFWKVVYKYPEELTQVFMSSNLIGGFHNRLEASRKYLFGSAGVYGTTNNSKIQGVYLARGKDWKSVFDVAPDFESYDFSPLDFSNPGDRKFIDETWAWTNEFDGLKYADGKVFK